MRRVAAFLAGLLLAAPAWAALEYTIAEGALPTSNGTFDVTNTSFGGGTPSVLALSLMSEGATKDTESDDTISYGVGVSSVSRAGLRIGESGRRAFSTMVHEVTSGSPGSDTDLDSFIADGVRYDAVDVGPSTDQTVGALLLGGTSVLNVASGVAAVPSSGSTTVSVGFDVSNSLIITAGVADDVGSSSAVPLKHFAFTRIGGSYSVTSRMVSRTKRTDTDDAVYGEISTRWVAEQITSASQVDWRIEITNAGADGWDYTAEGAQSPVGDEVWFLVIKFDTDVGIDVFDFTTATATGTTSHTGLTSNTPKVVGLVSTLMEAADIDAGVVTGSKAGTFGVSMFDDGHGGAGDSYAIAHRTQHTVGTGGAWFANAAILTPFDDGTMGTGAAAGNGIDADPSGMLSDGFTLNYNVTNTTGRAVIGFALSDAVSDTVLRLLPAILSGQ